MAPGSQSLGSMHVRIGMDGKGLIAGERMVRGKLAGLGKTIKSQVFSMNAVLAGLGAGLGVGFLAKEVLSLGASFEQTMATVGGVIRATGDELDMLTDKAREMGETTEWTATQAAESLQFLAMAGFDAGKAAAALPGTLDLATAGNLDLGRAADIATNALTAMGLPVEQLTRVNDVFVGTITRSNVNMEMLAESFKYAAPLAHAYGYSIEELSGMIGMLGNAGIQGSMAGTQLAMAIQKANDVALQMGYSSSDLIDVLENLVKEGRNGKDIMDLFGIRAGRAAVVLAGLTDETEEFQKVLGTTQGEAKTLADVMRDTLGGQYKEFKSVLESIKLDIFDNFGADLKKWLEDITEWFRKNREEILKVAQAVVDGIKIMWDGITFIWDMLTSFASGVKRAFAGVELASAEAALAIRQDWIDNDLGLQNLFVPPEASNWQMLWAYMKKTGTNIKLLAMATVEQLGAITGAYFMFLSRMLSSSLDSYKNAVENFNLKSITAAFLSGSWDPITEPIEKQKDILVQQAKDIKTTVTDLWDDMTDIHDKYRALEETRTPEEIFLADAGYTDLMKHTTIMNQSLSAFSKSAAKIAALRKKVAAATDKEEKPVLGSTIVSESVAAGQALKDLNWLYFKEIDAQRAAMQDYQQWLIDWSFVSAREMHMAFSDIFFMGLMGEFENFGDWLAGFWEQLMRNISDRASMELMGLMNMQEGSSLGGILGFIFKRGGGTPAGGSGGYGAGNYPEFATGGIVTAPTFAHIGEAGPEAVIPLEKFRDKGFMRALAGAAGGGRGDGVTLNQTVYADDARSFKASQSQIMSRAGVQMAVAQRRNG